MKYFREFYHKYAQIVAFPQYLSTSETVIIRNTCLKQLLQNFIQWRNGIQTRQQGIKNKRLSDCIFFTASL